ncbi:helix-turn-helix domain-containing protein [Alkalibaculum sp. M08DMB]|uniref:Helix-turn-helix domain-containing protein n=1 Tax=Alkalibaculum sporogenes TaxID=2655001 RepID=A0A6A7K7R5_9FIRM|nr:AraC family transcriptional regulator [Alkalibaculum sporogenes]MPW25435.1 helix-turn-helix domain-containing protein [Alkalibaculum sporogenes]
MKWLEKLSSAINYIENNLDNEISYEEAANIACCSTYYFKRMFTYVAGITLSDYIRRRRMTQAAFKLKSSNIKVLDVALKYGYNSPTAFNRAFQNVHGISPNAAKNQGSVLNAYPPIKFSVQVTGGSAMPYRIEEKDAMRIVGVRTKLSEDMEENQKFVPTFWSEILKTNTLSELCCLSNQAPNSVLGVTAYQSSNDIFYYIAVATNETARVEMFEYEIPAATWVVFESDGYFKESIQSVFRRFVTEWLPFSGYAYAELPDIEEYPFSNGDLRSGHSEVWIAIKKEEEN